MAAMPYFVLNVEFAMKYGEINWERGAGGIDSEKNNHVWGVITYQEAPPAGIVPSGNPCTPHATQL